MNGITTQPVNGRAREGMGVEGDGIPSPSGLPLEGGGDYLEKLQS